MTSLNTLLGDRLDEFLKSYWGRVPFYRDGSGADSFDDLISVRDIDRILSYASTRAPYVRLVKDGELQDASIYTYEDIVGRRLTAGLLDQGLLMDQLDSGATIVLDSVNHWLAPVRDLCEELTREFGGAAWGTVFISPPEQQNFDLHADSYEIFVLQLAGRKRWSLYPRLDPVPRAGAALELDDFDDVERETFVVRTGDLLYLPFGTPHLVQPLDSYAVHLSVAIRLPNWADVLEGLLEPIFASPDLNEPVHLGRCDVETLATQLKARLSQLGHHIAGLDPATLARRLVDEATRDRSRIPRAGLVDRCASDYKRSPELGRQTDGSDEDGRSADR